MAATTSFQIPQHVTALLSHLTSRPGVQSTFILSRKDGSIIQSTGLIASKPATNTTTTGQAPAPAPTEELESRPESAAVASPTSPTTSTTTPITDPSSPNTTTPAPVPTSPPAAPTQHQQPQSTAPYQPSQAEALAAHVFAFVASATDLSLSLSRPPGSSSETGGSGRAESGGVNGTTHEGGLNGVTSNDSGSGAREDGGEGFERDEDDEVKLLRMRTKKHEIVVVPDRKYLLCVVHDAAGAASGGGGGAAAAGGGGGAMGGVGGRGR